MLMEDQLELLVKKTISIIYLLSSLTDDDLLVLENRIIGNKSEIHYAVSNIRKQFGEFDHYHEALNLVNETYKNYSKTLPQTESGEYLTSLRALAIAAAFYYLATIYLTPTRELYREDKELLLSIVTGILINNQETNETN